MSKLFTRGILALIVLGGIAIAQQDNSQQVPADNTKVNQRDRNQSEATATSRKGTRLIASSHGKSDAQS
jgi:hypothetical protein